MKEISRKTSGADTFKAFLVKGHILQASDHERASVHSSGRGRNLRIDTTHHSWTNAWVQTESGNELEVQFLQSDPSVRSGHAVSLLFLQKNNGPLALFGVENQTTGQFSFRRYEDVRKFAGFKSYTNTTGLLGALALFGGGLAGLYFGTTRDSWFLGLAIPALSIGFSLWIVYSLDKKQGIPTFRELAKDIILKIQSQKSFQAIETS